MVTAGSSSTGTPLPSIGELLTVAEVARMGRFSQKTVTRWIARGWLRAFRRDRITRVLAEDFLAFLDANENP